MPNNCLAISLVANDPKAIAVFAHDLFEAIYFAFYSLTH